MNDMLEQIVANRRKDIAANPQNIAELESQIADRDDHRPFFAAIKKRLTQTNDNAIIAEIKRASPAKGLFCPNLDIEQTARDYELGWAICMSVLTEPRYFCGSMADLVAARKCCHLPVLQKDFIVTEQQIFEAALHADAILLIARCLSSSQISELYDLATSLRLDVLVEVFDEADAEKIAAFHFPLIGINHRNLATMGVDMQRSEHLLQYFDDDQIVVAASGIGALADLQSVSTLGIRAFLIGESLSRSENRVALLRQFVHAQEKPHHVR